MYQFTCGKEKFWCLNTFSLVSFAGMIRNKCAVLLIGVLTGGPQGKSPTVQVKELYGNLDTAT